jgi:hypothetical protein
MAQLTIYVPDEVEKKVRQEARRRGKSVSALISEMLKGEVEETGWHPDFFKKVVGGWKGPFPTITREPPEDRPPL